MFEFRRIEEILSIKDVELQKVERASMVFGVKAEVLNEVRFLVRGVHVGNPGGVEEVGLVEDGDPEDDDAHVKSTYISH